METRMKLRKEKSVTLTAAPRLSNSVQAINLSCTEATGNGNSSRSPSSQLLYERPLGSVFPSGVGPAAVTGYPGIKKRKRVNSPEKVKKSGKKKDKKITKKMLPLPALPFPPKLLTKLSPWERQALEKDKLEALQKKKALAKQNKHVSNEQKQIKTNPNKKAKLAIPAANATRMIVQNEDVRKEVKEHDLSFSPRLVEVKKTPEKVLPRGQNDTGLGVQKEPVRALNEAGIRLRNFLRLPKSHKWITYEFFYSDMDWFFFEGKNDFENCLKQYYPLLKARNLTRVEWCHIKKSFGKPRRFSSAFVTEERTALEESRNKIRCVQQNKISLDCMSSGLPERVPLKLRTDTKVSALVYRINETILDGVVSGMNKRDNTYLVYFNKFGLDTLSIPDFEVRAIHQPETILTSSLFINRSKTINSEVNDADAVSVTEQIVWASKFLKAKKYFLKTLSYLNTQAEKLKAQGISSYTSDFRIAYSKCILAIESLNKRINMKRIISETDRISQTFFTDVPSSDFIVPEKLKENITKEASELVTAQNSCSQQVYKSKMVKNPRTLQLITKLTSVLLQVQTLSRFKRTPPQCESLTMTIEEIRASLTDMNLENFVNKVEIPMSRIITGLSTSIPNTEVAKNYVDND